MLISGQHQENRLSRSSENGAVVYARDFNDARRHLSTLNSKKGKGEREYPLPLLSLLIQPRDQYWFSFVVTI